MLPPQLHVDGSIPISVPSLAPDREEAASEPAKEQLSTCITAIAAQSDPAKLATLGSRAANPRLKRIMYWLAAARDTGANPSDVINQAQKLNGSFGTPRAPLVKASLLRNLKICDGLNMLTPEDRALLRRGGAPVVNRGPYSGQVAEVDHIVPLAQAFEIGNELANLEMLPATLNRAKSDKVGERQLALAKKFQEAGLISDATMANIQAKFRPSSTVKFEHSASDMDAVETPEPTVTPLVPPPVQAILTAHDSQQQTHWWYPASLREFVASISSYATKTENRITALVSSSGEGENVWVNTKSHIYHRPLSHWYGRTQNGKYLPEPDALAEGDRAAKNNN